MHSKKTRTIISIFLIIIAFFGIMFAPMNSLRSSAAEDYRKWRQADSRWGSIKLGSSSETMASAGCLVTSLSILAVHSGAKSADSFNPGTLANSINNADGFNAYGGIANWATISTIIPDVKFVKKYEFTSSTQSGKIAEMQSVFDDGYYMVCNVGGHWVFVDSIVGSTVYMIDPAKDSTDMFGAYKNASITELRVFTGKNPPKSTSPTVATTTTPTTKPTTQPTTAKPYKLGEYYPKPDDYVKIYSENSLAADVVEYLPPDCVVDILEVKDGMGCIQLGAANGWIDMEKLEYAGVSETHSVGDINNDGIVDMIDLTLLNNYIASLSELPDGISILRKCELAAADINNDGIADNSDVLDYLALVCE